MNLNKPLDNIPAACYNPAMTKIDPAVSEYMKSLAKKSWEKRKGTQDMSAAGKKSAEVRWGKKDNVTSEQAAKPHVTKPAKKSNMLYKP